MHGNPLGKLINLKQRGTVEDYQHQFQSLLARAKTVRPDQQVDLFTFGLNDPIRMDVELQDPRNLATIMNLTCAYERRMQLERGQDIRRSNTNYHTTLHLPSTSAQNWQATQTKEADQLRPSQQALVRSVMQHLLLYKKAK